MGVPALMAAWHVRCGVRCMVITKWLQHLSSVAQDKTRQRKLSFYKTALLIRFPLLTHTGCSQYSQLATKHDRCHPAMPTSASTGWHKLLGMHAALCPVTSAPLTK